VCALILRCVKCSKFSKWPVIVFIHTKWICFVRHCSAVTVTAFLQFLEENGLYLMQVTLQDYCNVVLDYAEVELKKTAHVKFESRVTTGVYKLRPD
jgi:hypothetical protein